MFLACSVGWSALVGDDHVGHVVLGRVQGDGTSFPRVGSSSLQGDSQPSLSDEYTLLSNVKPKHKAWI